MASARKAPLIDIAMSAIAAPTMSCMFGNAPNGWCRSVRAEDRLLASGL